MKKTCSKCKIEKEITEFYKKTARNRKDTHEWRSRCKGCMRRAAHERPKANHLYKVECPSGYYYIGSTIVGIEQRRRCHIRAKGSTTLSKHIKENSLSQEDLKYSVVKEFQDPEEMRIAERDLIRSCYADPFLLNKRIPLRTGTDMSKRFCTKCKIEKPLEEFYYRRDKESYDSPCKQCTNTRLREYREANKEYYEANKEEIAKQRREYREANKEKIAKYAKEYYKANKEKKLLDN